jgi:hypothetical protein
MGKVRDGVGGYGHAGDPADRDRKELRIEMSS